MAITHGTIACPHCRYPSASYYNDWGTLAFRLHCGMCGHTLSEEQGVEVDRLLPVGDSSLRTSPHQGAYFFTDGFRFSQGAFRSAEHRARFHEFVHAQRHTLLKAWATERREDGYFYRVYLLGAPAEEEALSNHPLHLYADLSPEAASFQEALVTPPEVPALAEAPF